MRAGYVITMMALFAIMFLSGCIMGTNPEQGTTIVLTDKNPLVVVTAKTDNSSAMWFIDGVETKTSTRYEKSTVEYLLRYEELPAGIHKLRLSDSDETVEWNLVIGKPLNLDVAIVTNNSNRRGDMTPWYERHRIAKERLKNATT